MRAHKTAGSVLFMKTRSQARTRKGAFHEQEPAVLSHPAEHTAALGRSYNVKHAPFGGNGARRGEEAASVEDHRQLLFADARELVRHLAEGATGSLNHRLCEP